MYETPKSAEVEILCRRCGLTLCRQKDNSLILQGARTSSTVVLVCEACGKQRKWRPDPEFDSRKSER